MKLKPLIAASLLISLAFTSTGCEQLNIGKLFPGAPSTETATTGSISGLVLTQEIDVTTGAQTTARSVAAKDVRVQVLNQDDNEIAATTTNDAGQFFLDNLPAQGQELKIIIASEKPKKVKLTPARVQDMGLTLVSNTSAVDTSSKKRLTGTLVGPDGKPLAGATIKDKQHEALSVQSGPDGSFTFDILGKELLVETNGQSRTVSVEEVESKGRITIDVSPNTRVIKGIVRDKSNPNLVIPDIQVKISGTSLSVLTDKQGTFQILGAPLSSFTVETPEIEGYKGAIVPVGPGNAGDTVDQLIQMDPIGSLLIHVQVENSPSFFDPDPADPTKQIGCIIGLNCASFDVNLNGTVESGSPGGVGIEDFYDNKLGVKPNPLEGILTISGLNTTKKFSYPPALGRSILSASIEPRTLGTVVEPNFIVSIPIENIVGGEHTITVAMTGMQTQKSIVEVVPRLDIVSTEIITLRQPPKIALLGDIKGQIKGVDADDLANVKINFIDANEEVFQRSDENRSVLLQRVTQVLTTGQSTAPAVVLLDTEGNYLLQNVPTGSRVVFAGVIRTDNTLDPCYLPIAYSLVNVVGGIVNPAASITMNKRPLPECQ